MGGCSERTPWWRKLARRVGPGARKDRGRRVDVRCLRRHVEKGQGWFVLEREEAGPPDCHSGASDLGLAPGAAPDFHSEELDLGLGWGEGRDFHSDEPEGV